MYFICSNSALGIMCKTAYIIYRKATASRLLMLENKGEMKMKKMGICTFLGNDSCNLLQFCLG